jgi:hypothetical protein
MKVTLGRRVIYNKRTTWNAANADQARGPLQQALTEDILGALADEVIIDTPGMMRQLQAGILAAAEPEAIRMFDAMVRIIDNSHSGSGGFSAADLNTSRALRLRPASGSVSWKPLTDRWMDRKVAHRDTFFRNTDRLRSHIERYKGSFVRRMGGVKIVGLQTAARKGSRSLAREAQMTGKMALAHLEIQIFPNISPMLFGMLASRDWTSGANSNFTRTVLGDRQFAQKLDGPPGAHRPLLQPLTQFWILNRMPSVIQRAIFTYAEKNRAARMEMIR